jgi:hypothetical protein
LAASPARTIHDGDALLLAATELLKGQWKSPPVERSK